MFTQDSSTLFSLPMWCEVSSALGTEEGLHSGQGPPEFTLAIEDALDHFLQSHHVNKFTVGSRGQEVEEWGRGFWGRDLKQGFLQLLSQSQFGSCLAAGLVSEGAYSGGRADRRGSTHTACRSCLHVGQVHVDCTRAGMLR